MGSLDFEVLAGDLFSKVLQPEIDGVILVADEFSSKLAPTVFQTAIFSHSQLDDNFQNNVSIIPIELPAKRLIYSPVGNLTDYDDVRCYAEAANRGIQRALQAGVKTPFLLVPHCSNNNTSLVTILGALEALYVPIHVREEVPSKKTKISKLFIGTLDGVNISSIVDTAKTLEVGRIVARDIGGGDPERMAPPKVEHYVLDAFKNHPHIKIQVIDDIKVIEKEYPLFAAVNRAASVIERHRGRIIYLRYEPPTAVNSIYLVGKGITYDTGGADIKTNGVMAGMSRDKCGAAAVAGFFKVIAELQPKNTKFIGALCLARNSVGENSYVSDEVITARCGARVRVQNTDAEGRMVMGDVLCKLKEEAINQPNPHLFTIATLTGHAVLAVGPYTILMDNSVARASDYSKILQNNAEMLGDPLEISTIRREDLEFAKGRFEGDDVHQSGSAPSSRTMRGHQGPAGFLIKASGLDKCGLKSKTPLKYTHLDIAGSAGEPPAEPTGSPIIALYSYAFSMLKDVQ